MNFRNNILLLFVTFKIASCSWITGDFYTKYNIPETSGREIFDGEIEPLRPPLKEGMEGVFGIDANNNGVRDDVEIWINRKFDDPLKRKAYKEQYRFTALFMKLALDGRREEIESLVVDQDNFLVSCLLFTYDPIVEFHSRGKELKEFHNVVINTGARRNAYSKFIMMNRVTYGSSDTEKEIEYLENKCPFDESERRSQTIKYIKRYRN